MSIMDKIAADQAAVDAAKAAYDAAVAALNADQSTLDALQPAIAAINEIKAFAATLANPDEAAALLDLANKALTVLDVQ